MNPVVYVETTVVSYLTARPSREIVRAAQQEITQEWWRSQRGRFDLVASQLVILEAAAGDVQAAEERLKVLRGLRLVEANEAAELLAVALLDAAALPAKASRDALHVAICATNGVDYLLTWNCTHLANAMLREKIESTCVRAGYQPPIIATPEQLFDEVDDG